jgi:hypothetical protein
MQHVLRSEKRRRRTYNRILLGMSSMDLIYAVKCFVSTWPIPEETGAYLARGTTQTCTAAGFWGHGGSLSSAIYNGTLTWYFLLTIKYGMTQVQVRHKYEKWMHGIPLFIGWSTAIISLHLKLMNPIGWTCWIGPWPLECEAMEEMECERGDGSKVYRWAFFHAILWATFAFVAIGMLLIYIKIRTDERATFQYRFESQKFIQKKNAAGCPSAGAPNRRKSFLPSISSISYHRGVSRDSIDPNDSNDELGFSSSGYNRHRKELLSKRFATQSWYYILCFFISWIFPMAQFAATNAPDGTLYYPLLALTVIYIRPRYLRYRQKQLQEHKRQERLRKHRNKLASASESDDGAAVAVYDQAAPSLFGTRRHSQRSYSKLQALEAAIRNEGIDDDEDELEEQEQAQLRELELAEEGLDD